MRSWRNSSGERKQGSSGVTAHDAGLLCPYGPALRPARTAACRAHPEFARLLARAIEILAADPANAGRQHNIKKLADVQPGVGQWRLRLGRFRFLYDMAGRDAGLVHSALRREDTYRD